MRMNKKYRQVNEALLQEASISSIAAATIVVLTIVYISISILKFFKLISSASILPEQSDKMRQLEPRVRWDVYEIDVGSKLSVFALGKENIFVTSEALKVFTSRELEALMLHSIYLNNNHQMLVRHIADDSMAVSIFSMVFIIVRALFKSNNRLKSIVGHSTDFMYLSAIVMASAFTLHTLDNKRFKADRYTVKKGYGKDLISAFKKIYSQVMEDKYHCKGLSCKIRKYVTSLIKIYPDLHERIDSAEKETKKYNNVKKAALSVVTSVASDVSMKIAEQTLAKAFKR